MLGVAQGQTTAVALLLSAGARVDLQDKVWLLVTIVLFILRIVTFCQIFE